MTTEMKNPMQEMVEQAIGEAIENTVRKVIKEELSPLLLLAMKIDAGMTKATEAIEKAKNSGGFVGKLLKSVMDD